jgi:crotonobetainyl-CoA:carnitine CoA-transferase CaiB-like acyl-CoA transferase
MSSSPSDLPLAGLKVIDAATYIAAPCATAILSDFGAEVIKIERPTAGDPFRGLYRVANMPRSEHNYSFEMDNRNKRSLALNLGSAEGQGILRKLVEGADVFVTNYQPQMQARYALRYEDLTARNERLIYAMVTGYGEAGEEAEKPGYDMTAYFARSGLMSFLHNEGADPCLSPCGFGDHPTSVSLFGGIMLALYRRLQTGKGGKVSTTLAHNGVWSNASMVQAALCGAEFQPKPRRETQLNPLVNHYATSDGRRVLFCLLDPAKDWQKLCAALGRADWLEHPRFSSVEGRREYHVELIAALDVEILKRPLREWTELFAQHDVLFGIVPHTSEIPGDAQLQANGVFRAYADAPYQTIDSPMQLSGVNKVEPSLAPSVGQHSREVLLELGYPEADVDALVSAGVVHEG